MEDPNIVFNREIRFLRFYRTGLQLLLPSFSELQWIAISAMLFSELFIYRQPLLQLAAGSWLSTVYGIFTLLVLFWFLFLRLLPRKPLVAAEKLFISVVYYSFYALFAGLVLRHDVASTDSWFQLVNHYLTLAILGLAILRGLTVLLVFKMNNPFLELVVAERMNDRQYAPLALLAVSVAIPLAIYGLQNFYDSYTPPAFLAVVYVSFMARVVEIVWLNFAPPKTNS